MTLAHRRRDLDGLTGLLHSEANPASGRDWAGNLTERMNDVRGQATILAGSDDVAVQLDEELAGQPAMATLNTLDGTLTVVRAAIVDSQGLLTITGDANATGNVLVTYCVLGKNVA